MQTDSIGPLNATGATAGSHAVSSLVGPTTETQWLQDQADQLRQVALQMDTFLNRQLERLQRHVTLGATCNQQEFEEVQATFHQMKLKWEQERQQEKQQLLEDAQRLSEAWERLEQEQREILKQRATFKTAAVSAPPTPVPGADGTLQPSRVEVKPKATPLNYSAESMTPTANAKNQMQFQQLRREMLEHSRQHRKR